MSLWQARPVVGRSGVELCCPSCTEGSSALATCDDDDDVVIVDDSAALPMIDASDLLRSRASQPRLGVVVGAVGAVMLMVVGALSLRSGSELTAADESNLMVPISEMELPQRIELDEIVIEEVALPLPDIDLEQWVHPIAGAKELVPVRMSRRFGARRAGADRPAECGQGHCGLDYESPRGSPVVAVKDGVIERVVHDPNRPSGKYVRLLHDDDSSTIYMHLNDILDGLRRGDSVRAGDMLGSVGRTGIKTAQCPDHLHFAMKERNRHGHERFVDPIEQLRGARVVELLDIYLPESTATGRELAVSVGLDTTHQTSSLGR